MGSIRRYIQFIKPYQQQIFLTYVIGVIKFAIPLLLPLLLKYVVDDLLLTSISTEEKLQKLAWVIAGTFLIFTVVRVPVEYYRQYLAQKVASQVLFDIRNHLFDHLQRLSLRFYHNQKVGQITSRVINDVEQTKEFVVTGMMNIWLDMVTLLIAIAMMVWLDPFMTLVSLAIFPLYGVAVKYFFKHLRSVSRERSQALAELQGHLHERVQGISVIRAFHLEDHEKGNFIDKNRHFLNKAINHSKWLGKTFASINTITDLAPIIVICVAAYQVIAGGLTVGEMMAFYGYLNLIYSPIRRLVNSSTTLTQAHASMDRVFEFMDEPYEIVDRKDAVEIEKVKGKIQFEQVKFRYYDEQDLVLKGVDLQIEPGQTVALVGPSGGGKSSIISLIPRFYDVTGGKVSIDGRDLRDITIGSLRRSIGLVLQDNILFSGSVEENIRMGKQNASTDEVIEAAKAANAHEFIMELPNGYQTEIGERGVKLSGGQKQRIALARLFLKDPTILILDEATSALDLQSEHLVQESLERLAKHRTTIVIAHRLSTVTHADQIFFIEHGVVKEAGTHDELMTRDGKYAQLFKVQHLHSPSAY